MFLSTNAWMEADRNLCVCFSDDHKSAVLATIKEADSYKSDINQYVNKVNAKNMLNEKDLAQALGVKEASISDDYYEFEKSFVKIEFNNEYYAKINNKTSSIDNNTLNCIIQDESKLKNKILITKEDFENAEKGHKIGRLIDIKDLYGELDTVN
jgi:hypothetical protein